MPEREEANTVAAPETPIGHGEMEHALQTLDPRARRLWRRVLLTGTALAVVAAAAAALAPDPPVHPLLLAAAVLVAGLALSAFWPAARYRSWGFLLRPDDLLIRRGVLWRTISVVPHTRIQHVDTRRGPFERSLGLARVVVYTAGTRGAALTIPGLDAGDAEALRDRLAALGGAGDAV